MNSIGKERRLDALRSDDGNILTVAMDHGGYAGPLDGIRNIGAAIETIANAGADAIIMTPGTFRNNYDRIPSGVGVVLRIDGTGSIMCKRDSEPYQLIDVGDALQLGADAVIAMGYLETDTEVDSLSLMSDIASDCANWGLPFIAEMVPLERNADPEAVALAARIGSEYGADLIKTYYTGDEESFRGVVESTPADILVLGGPKRESRRAVYEDVSGAINAGGAGIAMGRNIWQSEDPAATVQRMRALIHENRPVEDVLG